MHTSAAVVPAELHLRLDRFPEERKLGVEREMPVRLIAKGSRITK